MFLGGETYRESRPLQSGKDMDMEVMPLEIHHGVNGFFRFL